MSERQGLAAGSERHRRLALPLTTPVLSLDDALGGVLRFLLALLSCTKRPSMHPSAYTADDFGHSPLMFYYEVTQACDLVCKHCRASAQEEPHPEQLATNRPWR